MASAIQLEILFPNPPNKGISKQLYSYEQLLGLNLCSAVKVNPL